MVAFPLYANNSYHARSSSLPCSPHPITEQFQEHLARVRSSETASTSSFSSVSHRLSALGDLYDCVDELLLLPINQQIIAQNRQATWVDHMLDGSLKMLDICGTARDTLLQTRERIQDIQSVFRRRYNGELNLRKEVEEYLSIRRKVTKAIKSCLRVIKKADKNDETSFVIVMLRDVEAITIDILKTSLIQIAGSDISKKASWSLSKLVHQKGDSEGVTSTSEFENLDAALSSLIKKKTGINLMQVDNLRSQMVKVESEIQHLDDAFESLFKHLVKTRATFLNILSN